MDPKLKALLDRYSAAGASDDELRQVAADWQKQNAAAPVPGVAADASSQPGPVNPPESTAAGFGRAALQHGLFNFGDELGLVDPVKQKAFAKQHPILDFLATLTGGAAVPIAATAAAPELATVGGAAALGGLTGLASGAGEGSTLDERGKNAAISGAAGLVGGAAAAKLGHVVGQGASNVLDRINPKRVPAREAMSLFDSPEAVQAHINHMNDIAPGSSSIATATRPDVGLTDMSRFTGAVKGLGESGPAAAQAEADMVAQRAAQEKGLTALGLKMDDLSTGVDASPELRSTLKAVKSVLGNKRTPKLPDLDYRLISEATPDRMIETAQSPHPSLRQAVSDFWDNQGEAFRRNPGTETIAQQNARTALERHGAEDIVNPSLSGSPTVVPGQPAQYAPETVDIQVLRDALGRLRYLSRQAAQRGTEANGPTLYEIDGAKKKLESLIYDRVPAFKNLDQHYAQVMDEMRTLDPLLETTQRSRSNFSGNRMAGKEATTMGGSVTKAPTPKNLANVFGLTDLIGKAFDKDPSIAPALTQKYITSPGGPDAVANLLRPGKLDRLINAIPLKRPVGSAIQSQLPAGMRSLFDDITSPNEHP